MRVLSEAALIGLPGNLSVTVVFALLGGAASDGALAVTVGPGAAGFASACAGAVASWDSSPSSQPLPFSGGEAGFSSDFGVAGDCSFGSVFAGASGAFSAVGAAPGADRMAGFSAGPASNFNAST